MSLRSVLQTALSGMTAAQSAIGVVGNNMANSQTPGFKASRPSYASLKPQTSSLGAASSATSGGANPVQVGNGVRMAGMSRDFSQGSLEIGGSATQMAIEGEGLFILQGSEGERSYTRDGNFGLNADGELISSGGGRVMGYGVDDQFRLQTAELTTLQIPSSMQAKSDDGTTATLLNIEVSGDGRISGRFSDGLSRDLGQVAVARFANPAGLQGGGDNTYQSGVNSGLPIEGSPSDSGFGTIVSGATELSNTDIGRSLVDLSLASTMFRANARVLDTGGQLLDELASLSRPR